MTNRGRRLTCVVAAALAMLLLTACATARADEAMPPPVGAPSEAPAVEVKVVDEVTALKFETLLAARGGYLERFKRLRAEKDRIEAEGRVTELELAAKEGEYEALLAAAAKKAGLDPKAWGIDLKARRWERRKEAGK